MKKNPQRLKHRIEIQSVCKSAPQPDRKQMRSWADAALEETGQSYDCVIRIVGERESADLNQQYRHKSGPTNILSFPFEMPDGIDPSELPSTRMLGDLVICAPVVEREALEQHKKPEHHWAHIVIHGILHLLGYDHLDEKEAESMENKEITILKKFHISNPYNEVQEQ
ncbi:MAG: rRNA maturation RNase YbeY [Gammaproteobacteria bacterium]